MTRPRRAHERRLSWVAIAIGASGRGYGHCGDVGHRHADQDEAYACPWWPATAPEPVAVYVRRDCHTGLIVDLAFEIVALGERQPGGAE